MEDMERDVISYLVTQNVNDIRKKMGGALSWFEGKFWMFFVIRKLCSR